MIPLKTTTTRVHLFDSGKAIQDGDRFRASIDSVEGRRRVTLTKVENTHPAVEYCPLCYEKFDGKKKHGSWCK